MNDPLIEEENKDDKTRESNENINE